MYVGYCTVCCLIVSIFVCVLCTRNIGFVCFHSLLCFNYSVYVFIPRLCLFYCLVCFAFYFVCSVFFVYCFSLCIMLFLLICLQVYGPLPLGGNPTAVNKYQYQYRSHNYQQFHEHGHCSHTWTNDLTTAGIRCFGNCSKTTKRSCILSGCWEGSML
jgi:hypothetical protein